MDWHKNEEINPVELEGSNCRIYGLKEKNKKATTYNKSQFRRQKTGNKKEHELTPTRPASSQYLERIEYLECMLMTHILHMLIAM